MGLPPAPVGSINILPQSILNGTPGNGSSFALPGVPHPNPATLPDQYNEKPQAEHFCRARYLHFSVWRFAPLNEPNSKAQVICSPPAKCTASVLQAVRVISMLQIHHFGNKLFLKKTIPVKNDIPTPTRANSPPRFGEGSRVGRHRLAQ